MTVTGRSKYSTGAMIFHWVIAVAVIVNWRFAEAAEHAATRELAAPIWANHKALGITILVLTLARLAWRLTHKVPPLPDTMKSWERVLSRTVHVIFYAMLIGLPIGGWLGSSYFGGGVDVFGLFSLPALPVGENPDAGKAIFGFHSTGGEILIYLIGLHILGALKHTFIDKSGGLSRMLPFGKG
ncbi:cytochrome b [Parerythrobacter jejuensis]|uniref:Cytochrome b n=1 Tax=Parerythrobacter jejuensis TaxID=795812 RepID=A0A845AM67_9SPHN|nr:cytochrome b [Parerythrobacter jejuensis]MXP31882.1 cytochrome b [Parerythrobacter jejuensis]